MACAHFDRDQICTQVDASFSLFGYPTQVNASGVTSIHLLLANEITGNVCLKMFFFCDLRVLVRKLAFSFGRPTEVSTQVQSVWPGLKVKSHRKWIPKLKMNSSFIDFILVLHQKLQAGSANISTSVPVYPWFIVNRHHVTDSNISADE